MQYYVCRVPARAEGKRLYEWGGGVARLVMMSIRALEMDICCRGMGEWGLMYRDGSVNTEGFGNRDKSGSGLMEQTYRGSRDHSFSAVTKGCVSLTYALHAKPLC